MKARPVCRAERPATDRCPGSLALHRAQDGWLARIRIPGGRLSAPQLRALASASKLGSGLIELTSRANLQLRGLPPVAGESLAACLRAAGLLPSPAHDRVRNILASPVAGRHPRSRAHTDGIVAAIDRELCDDPCLAELPGRFLFAVDDGSGLALGQPADVALIACGEGRCQLALAGRATATILDARDAAGAAVRAARAFLAERRAQGGRPWRVAELDGGAAAVAKRLGTELAGPVPRLVGEPLSPGPLAQRDGRLALTALAPLGRLDGSDLAAIATLAAEIRVGAGRTVTVLDVDPGRAASVQARLRSRGLELRPDSGWVGLTACAGLGRCRTARLDVVAVAAARAGARRPGSPAEHWAACERRCGERVGQPIAIAPTAAGVAVRVGETERTVADLDGALEVLGS